VLCRGEQPVKYSLAFLGKWNPKLFESPYGDLRETCSPELTLVCHVMQDTSEHIHCALLAFLGVSADWKAPLSTSTPGYLSVEAFARHHVRSKSRRIFEQAAKAQRHAPRFVLRGHFSFGGTS
jgi:hypothetical protein